MKAKRKRHEPAFKAKVGLEALKEIKSVRQLAQEFQLHPTQVAQWKALVRERLPDVFTQGPTAQPKSTERESARLHEKIGELTMELDWLKKKSKQLGL